MCLCWGIKRSKLKEEWWTGDCRSVEECVQSRHKTLGLILGRIIKSIADRRDSQCMLVGNQSLSAVCVGRNLVSPLGQMPSSAAGWSQADSGGLLGDIFSCLPNRQLVLSLYLLISSFLPPWVPLSFGFLKEGLKCSHPLGVKCLRGEAGSMVSESSGFDSRLYQLVVLWTLPLHVSEISTERWVIAKVKQSGSWKRLDR